MPRNCIVIVTTATLGFMIFFTLIEGNFVPKGKSKEEMLEFALWLVSIAGRKCRLQEQHCDIMHPDKQCCPGTSCGIRNINNNIVNICLMCRDIGQPCGTDKGACCRGLKCQKVTQFASACNPVDYRFFADSEIRTSGKIKRETLGGVKQLQQQGLVGRSSWFLLTTK